MQEVWLLAVKTSEDSGWVPIGVYESKELILKEYGSSRSYHYILDNTGQLVFRCFGFDYNAYPLCYVGSEDSK